MIKKVANYVPSIILPILINFLLLFLYGKYLSPEEYGKFNIYFNTINLIYALSLSFIQTAAFRFYSIKDKVKSYEIYYSTYFFANIILTLLVLIILLITKIFISELDVNLLTFCILVNALFNFYLNIHRLEDNYKKYTFAKVFSAIQNVILYLGFILLANELDYKDPIIAFYGSYLIIIILEAYKRRRLMKLKYFSISLLKESFNYGFPLIGVSVMNMILVNSSQYILLFYLGEKEVGLYSIGYKISDIIFVNLTMIILLVMYPILMQKYDNNKIAAAQEDLTKMLNLNSWITIPIVLAIFIYIDSIIMLLFPGFIGAEEVTKVILLVSILRSISMFTSKGLELAKETKKIFFILSFSAILNILYNLIFIPMYGMMAAAHSSIISYVVYNILLIKHSAKYIKIHIDYRYSLKVIGIAVTTCCLGLAIQNYWIVSNIYILITQLIVCSIFYLLLTYIFKLLRDFKLSK